MRCAVAASFWPASEQIAQEVKTRRNTLKKLFKHTRSNIFSKTRYLTCTSCWTSQFGENSRFLPFNAGNPPPCLSMKFHYGASVYSPTRTRLSLKRKYEIVYIASRINYRNHHHLEIFTVHYGGNRRNEHRCRHSVIQPSLSLMPWTNPFFFLFGSLGCTIFRSIPNESRTAGIFKIITCPSEKAFDVNQ